MGAGCWLRSMKFNIICYADDIVLVAPSRAGLQLLINEISYLLCGINLKINVEESCYTAFNKKVKGAGEVCIKLQGLPLQRTSEITYNGVVVTDRLKIVKDVGRPTNSF